MYAHGAHTTRSVSSPLHKLMVRNSLKFHLRNKNLPSKISPEDAAKECEVLVFDTETTGSELGLKLHRWPQSR